MTAALADPPLYPTLFSPLQLRHLTLKHRINFGTHSPNMAIAGRLGDRHLHYYLERARGGAAMICIEPLAAHATAVNTRGQFHLADESSVPYFRRLTETCHAAGAIMLQQIFHIGPHADTENSGLPAWSPSGTLSSKYNAASHAMTSSEVEEVIAGFVESAHWIRESGFDGVEINAGYDSLIPAFWSPRINKRGDRWGGSFENRMRFSVEILSRIRACVGDRFLVAMTMTGDDRTPGGMDLAARQEIAAYLDQRGLIDYVAIKTGSYFDWTRVMPTFMYEGMQGPEAAGGIRSVLRHARVQAESLVRTPANAEQVLASGAADMVSLVRAQIADPHLANKAAANRPQSVRGCISCNQVCWGRRARDYWLSCLVNPSVGREHEWGGEEPPPAETPQRVLVVGAGPAGLETARVAAQRGHRVTLVDRDEKIGGQFRLAATQPRRGDIAQLLHWHYLSELDRLDIDLRLNTEADASLLAELGPEVVVMATGSVPAMDGRQRLLPAMRRLPGIEAGNVFSINEVLRGSNALGKRVLLLDDIDGWMPAAGTVAFMAQRGHAVSVVTSAAVPMASLANSTADGPLRRLWVELGVEVLTDSLLVEWSGAGARLRDTRDGEESLRAFDSLVLATLNRPDRAAEALLADGPWRFVAVGDCVAPRTAAAAFHDGRKLALEL